MPEKSRPALEKNNSGGAERAGQGLAFLVGIGLLFFASAFLVIYPNQDMSGYSELIFFQKPVLDSNATNQIVHFGVRVNCFENEETAYHLVAKFEGQIVATKDLTLRPKRWEEVSFSVPVRVSPGRQNEVRVTASRASTIAGKADDRIPLEVFDWFSS